MYGAGCWAQQDRQYPGGVATKTLACSLSGQFLCCLRRISELWNASTGTGELIVRAGLARVLGDAYVAQPVQIQSTAFRKPKLAKNSDDTLSSSDSDNSNWAEDDASNTGDIHHVLEATLQDALKSELPIAPIEVPKPIDWGHSTIFSW